MTDRATLLPSSGPAEGSGRKVTTNRRFSTLADAIALHAGAESASFHTPGHKGRSPADFASFFDAHPRQADLTELPGLDDLSCPTGVLRDLEARAAGIWGAAESIISVNGASAALEATMLALAAHGTTVLVPRNAHRSIIHGLVLSGLFPLWYEPVWDDEWGLWGSVAATSVERLLERLGSETAGLIIVSPTYAGAISDIQAIAGLCRDYGIPLVVDEAHGAHFVPKTTMPVSAVGLADVTVHSLHKTLPALTQTGLLHIRRNSLLVPDALRSTMQLLQSSSPSYLLMASIEQALQQVELQQAQESIGRLDCLCRQLREAVSNLPEYTCYAPPAGSDPSHILLGCPGRQPEQLYGFLAERGIFAETILGNGVLFMLGLGTTAADVQLLTAALSDFGADVMAEPAGVSAFVGMPPPAPRPSEIVQILSPRQAFMMPATVVPVNDSVGRISQATIAPCPPGTPLLVAGQRVPAEILECAGLQSLRVVVDD